MKLGIKTGPQKDSISSLEATRPDFCEVWFNVEQIDNYQELFTYLHKNKGTAGLHFWGAIDTTLANLAYPDNELLHKSRQLVAQTIDVAAQHKFWYVNIHPGAATIEKVDFKKGTYHISGQKVPFEKCIEPFTQSLTQLSEYAYQKGVNLYVESVPSMGIDPQNLDNRDHFRPLDDGMIPTEYFEPLFASLPHLGFANDFGHTCANLISSKREQIRMHLFDLTKRLQKFTKLIHAGFIIPPYNGTDYHGSLYEPAFATDAAIPNKSEMQDLLKLFIHRDDVGVLVEPRSDHVGNFKALKQLIETLN